MSLTFQTFLSEGAGFPNNHYGQAEVRGKQKVKYQRVQGHITSQAEAVIAISVPWLIPPLWMPTDFWFLMFLGHGESKNETNKTVKKKTEETAFTPAPS